MRKFNLLLGIFICAIILSCSSDDSNDNQQEENATIFGEWKLTSKLMGGNSIQLEECEQGEGVIFLESFVANCIIVDEIGTIHFIGYNDELFVKNKRIMKIF